MRLSLCPILLVVLAGVARADDAKVDYNRDVRPILSGTCFKCHGVDDKARKAKLRLDDRESALKAGKSGERAIVPGKPDESELMRRVLTKDEDDIMPPASTHVVLTDLQKATLKKWIAQGAEYQAHWAFVAPKRPAVPEVKNKKWVRNAIDAFILARLEKEGLSPSKEADRYTLIRRLSLDLVGLPPTPEEADAFVKDASPDAYEKVVDRLLASPRYGERWARRWLDLARYADTNGYEKDRPRSIWAYRDWVINALNADMPFDQFTVEQLAGDMLPNATPQQRIATGFHRNTMRNEEGGIDPLEFRYYSVVDRINTTGTAWLGLTVGCAQCHTHKFDPIKNSEYYSLLALLNNADEPETDLPSPDIDAKKKEIEAKIEKLTAELPNKWPADAVTWEIATPINAKATAAGAAKLESSAEDSWRANGPAVQTDTYTFTIQTDLKEIDRIKLEALKDAPKIGPGRTTHGNFVLTEVRVSITPPDGAADAPQKPKIARGEASYAQKGFPISEAFDGKNNTGWAIDGEPVQKDRTATFYFDKPAKVPKGSRVTVVLDQQYGKEHVIGRLRLSLGGPANDSRPADVRRKEAIDAKFAAWLAHETPKAVKWQIVKPSSMQSNAPTLTLLEDNSILASGDITKSDTYTLGFDGVNLKGVTAVRIEAIPHPSLPKNGPGMVYYEGPMGDFSLSNISVWADGKQGKFAKAVASYAQNNSGADRAIDDNLQTGWMINGGQGKPHVAVFALDKPTDAKDLKLALLFEKYYAAALGHFRVSVTTDAKALDPLAQPPEVEEALLVDASKRTAAQNELLMRRFLMSAPELATPRKEIDQLFRSIPTPQTTLVMKERPASHPRTTKIHHRGEFLQTEDEVQPGVPAFLPPLPKDAGANRLAFAKWLVSPENPLTARVAANRQWQAFFGRGLVRTLEDFGLQGESPTHPDLLDWLAVELHTPADGKQPWSMKRLHRMIVCSATYRQASAVTSELLAKDPQNLLLARGPRFRPEAEIIRDSALAESGLLSGKIGGPSVFPPQPPSVTTEGAYGALTWTPSTGEDRYRRSLYTFTKRTAPFAMYNTFDAPTGESCIARREVSNTPLQSLTLLNDQMFLEAAQALGKSVAEMKGDDASKAKEIFRRVLTRPPTEEEVQMLTTFAAEQRTRFEKKELDAEKFSGGKEDAVNRATWAAVSRAVMNLDEAVTKN